MWLRCRCTHPSRQYLAYECSVLVSLFLLWIGWFSLSTSVFRDDLNSSKRKKKAIVKRFGWKQFYILQMWKHPCAQVIFDSDPAPKGRSQPAQMEEMSQAMIRYLKYFIFTSTCEGITFVTDRWLDRSPPPPPTSLFLCLFHKSWDLGVSDQDEHIVVHPTSQMRIWPFSVDFHPPFRQVCIPFPPPSHTHKKNNWT